MKRSNIIDIHLDAAQAAGYSLIGLTYSNLIVEEESQDYGACTFNLNNKAINFRVAKITPTKIGQFVAIWKRIGNGPIMPYDMNDSFDLFVISVQSSEGFGQFVFPKTVLLQKGFLSKDGTGGKRGMRVYPPWDTTDSAQAQKTQAWQTLYFVEIQPHLDIDKLRRLISL